MLRKNPFGSDLFIYVSLTVEKRIWFRHSEVGERAAHRINSPGLIVSRTLTLIKMIFFVAVMEMFAYWFY